MRVHPFTKNWLSCGALLFERRGLCSPAVWIAANKAPPEARLVTFGKPPEKVGAGASSADEGVDLSSSAVVVPHPRAVRPADFIVPLEPQFHSNLHEAGWIGDVH